MNPLDVLSHRPHAELSEFGEVQLLGVAQTADEVSRIEQLRDRFGWWVQFDVRLLDATPCAEPLAPEPFDGR
jgi:hypothetical protein